MNKKEVILAHVSRVVPHIYKMLDSLFCECGGKYQHVDTEIENKKVLDTYQCDGCETWCVIVWHKDTQAEIERSYGSCDGDDCLTVYPDGREEVQ